MTHLDTTQIRDAFERDLAGYHAPPGLAQRARSGGLRRARRRRLEASAGLAAAAGAAAIAVTVWPVGGTPPATAAPFIVTQGPHGTIVINSREFLTKAQGAQLQRQLRAQGVPVRVSAGNGNQLGGQHCQTAGYPYPRGMWSRVFIASRITRGRVMLVIRPAALAPGTGILLSGGPTTVYAQKPGGPVRKLTEPNSLGWGFVKASPECTGT